MSRWSDNDRNFGPFTFSWTGRKGYRPLAVILKSWGSGDDGPASLRLSLILFTFIVRLPPILYPQRHKVYPASWDSATVARLGRDWYWDVKVREYGFSYSDGFFQLHYGICPGDSSLDQMWSKFLPWTQWRHVRHSFYGLNGELFWTIPEGMKWDESRKIEAACPTVAFTFKDFDDQELIATTKIEEREWHFGTGWFKWLSWFVPAKIRRSLDLEFSGETGPEKGSWKGGTVGTGIEMLPGELHESAFRRYCAQEHRSKYSNYSIKFIGRSDRDTANSLGK
jgi:hypothetical protein